MEGTSDVSCFIEHRGQVLGVDVVVYRNTDGERWLIRGTCSGCGVCDGDSPHSGPPEGRLDIPVRPEGPPTWEGCTLSGVYF